MKKNFWKIVLTVLKYAIAVVLGALGSDELPNIVSSVM